MHSSRMRTSRSSSCLGGLRQAPPRSSPPGPGTPRNRHPPSGAGIPPWDQAPPYGQTHTCKHITLPQTSFVDGKYETATETTCSCSSCEQTRMHQSTFLQTHKVVNNGINANFVFLYIYSFLLCLDLRMLVKLKLDVIWQK